MGDNFCSVGRRGVLLRQTTTPETNRERMEVMAAAASTEGVPSVESASSHQRLHGQQQQPSSAAVRRRNFIFNRTGGSTSFSRSQQCSTNECIDVTASQRRTTPQQQKSQLSKIQTALAAAFGSGGGSSSSSGQHSCTTGSGDTGCGDTGDRRGSGLASHNTSGGCVTNTTGATPPAPNASLNTSSHPHHPGRTGRRGTAPVTSNCTQLNQTTITTVITGPDQRAQLPTSSVSPSSGARLKTSPNQQRNVTSSSGRRSNSGSSRSGSSSPYTGRSSDLALMSASQRPSPSRSSLASNASSASPARGHAASSRCSPGGRSRASSSTTLDTAGAASNSTRESVVPVAPSQPTLPSGQSGNTLTVPSTSQTANSPLAPPTTSTRGQPMGSLGAIPRTSEHAQESEARSCFCGHYSEASTSPNRKRRRCKFCRSKAKYIPGQRSFDAGKLFGRRRERTEPRRALSEDRRDDEDTQANDSNDTATNTTGATSSLTALRHSLFHRKSVPFLRRQERLNVCESSVGEILPPPPPPPMTHEEVAEAAANAAAACSYNQASTRDHGLRTPPGPPPTMSSAVAASTGTSTPPILLLSSSAPAPHQHRLYPPPGSLPIRTMAQCSLASRHAGGSDAERRRGVDQQRMAHDLVAQYLAPPSRPASLSRALTDPTSQTVLQPRRTPVSPPPTYEEVVKESNGRCAPPTYEEALSIQTASSLRLMERGVGNGRSLSHDESSGGAHPSPPPPFRSSAPRPVPGASIHSIRENPAVSAVASERFSTSLPSPRVRGGLMRSARAEEIPDIYWEQAARELDFCTCRKCQARYRQYFEEDQETTDSDILLPLETQVLMQEVLSDGWAFCSLM